MYIITNNKTQTISLKKFKSGYRSWRESATIYPSGIHLGRQHALLDPDGIHHNDETKDFTDTMWIIHHNIKNIAIPNENIFT